MKQSSRIDLGVRSLWPAWKAMFQTKDLRDDVVSGLSVACIAVPLSLAIALASGVTPEIGLITAIVGGIVCALFGGTPLAVSGPAAAMAVLLSSIVQQHGLGGLLITGLGCGILQLIFGVIGWGKFARFVPMPVIAGFTAGIGAVIFIGQLPRALGLPAPKESETLNVITHLADYLHATNGVSLFLSLLSFAIIMILPKINRKIPATLVGVIVASLVAVFFGLQTATIGQMPDSLPIPKIPGLPTENFGPLIIATLTVFGLASLETLLSATAIDKLARCKRHDPNQELIGQGLGNIASSMFGGLPVTGVIARGALNVQSGAKSRRSAIIHAFALLLIVFFASDIIAQIPIAALAGVLLAVSIRMMNVREFREIWKVSRVEGAVYVFTFISIVAVDLLVGIQLGVIAAIAITAIRAGTAMVSHHEAEADTSSRIHINGALSFLSHGSFDRIRSGIDSAKANGRRSFIVDFSDVSRIDASAAEEIITITREATTDGSNLILQGLRPECRLTLEKADHENVLNGRMVTSETELRKTIEEPEHISAVGRLLYGIERFRKQRDENFQPLLDQLAESQAPHTLFVTCSDSRINPNLLTSTAVGELFVVRNVGNAIPPSDGLTPNSERGALEFSIKVLGVRDIVICGHTNCGAMKAIVGGAKLPDMPNLRTYLTSASFTGLAQSSNGNPEQATQINVLNQRANLLTYPFIREMVAAGDLRIHLWIYDVRSGEIEAWNAVTREFSRIDSSYKPHSKQSEINWRGPSDSLDWSNPALPDMNP